jgi:hypothetical protein
MWKDESPTRPDTQRVQIIQQQERPTWQPPRRVARMVVARKDEVSADLSRDGRTDPR